MPRSRAVAATIAASLILPILSAHPAQADYSFSAQRPLTLPDPFLKKKRQRVTIVPAMASPDREILDITSPNRADLDPALVTLVAKIEMHFGAPATIHSGCRSLAHNRAVHGALHSYHLSCSAADITIAGFTPAEIRAYAMTLPERGGVGTYCSMSIVHVDTGPKRQWHWPCDHDRRFSFGRDLFDY